MMTLTQNEIALERAFQALNRLLSHKTDSLFAFVLEASPYVTEADAERLQCVQRLAQEHQEQAQALTRLILEMDGVPNPLGHDIGVADMNYLSLRFLTGPLIEYQEHVLSEEREALGPLAHLAPRAAFPAARRLVEEIIEADEHGLEKLKSLQGPHPSPPRKPQQAS